jgi:dihydrofolate reductase
MSIVTCRFSMSLDGYSAAPGQSLDEPFGVGGMRLPQWQFEADRPGRENDAALIAEVDAGIGAYVMGRKMFGGGGGEWDESWRGWWGEEPPYHAPVFVLTHHERAPLELTGTTFHFVTDGIESALERARAAAGEQNVSIAGGASAVRQCLAAGLLDELVVHLVPITIGAGERPLDGAGEQTLEQVSVVVSPTVTHLRYRVIR